MRARYGVWLTACAVVCSISHAETRFPYDLTVELDGVAVRSGPSRDFYVTDRLSTGDTIQVYRHEPGGWLAIRPPEGSFSLVQRSRVQWTSRGNVGTVLDDETVCRVGSRLVEVEQFATPVTLRQGELVELLDTPVAVASSDQATGDDPWLRIWPPAGEFRWVHEDDVGPPRETPQRPAGSDRPAVAPAGEAWEPSSDSAASASESPVDTSAESQRRARSEAPSSNRESGGLPDQKTDDSTDEGESQTTPVSASKHPQTASDKTASEGDTVRVPPESEIDRVATKSSASSDTASADETRRQDPPPRDDRQRKPSAAGTPAWVARHPKSRDDLDGLELELATMVSKDMRAWRLGALRRRVEAMLQKSENRSEQSRAQGTLDRIRDFEALLDRAVAANQPDRSAAAADATVNSPAVDRDMSPNAGTPQTGPSLDEVPRTDGLPEDTTSVERQSTEPSFAGQSAVSRVEFDGSGWLVPVHTSKGAVPPYALLDAQGDVLHYVSPTPGLNLQRYVRKQIGVFGQRGYVRRLNKPHVTAEHVVDLGRHLR